MNSIETPAETMYQNDISKGVADSAAASNPYVLGMQILGGLGVNFGINKAGGLGGIAKGVGSGLNEFIKAYGGEIKHDMVEVEDEEIIEEKDGTIRKISGKKHEQGGEKVFMKKGANVYSARIKFGGETLAKRKEKRTSAQKKLDKMSAIDQTLFARKGAKLARKKLKEEDAHDLKLQELVLQYQSGSKSMNNFFKYGVTDWDPTDPNPYYGFFWNNILGGNSDYQSNRGTGPVSEDANVMSAPTETSTGVKHPKLKNMLSNLGGDGMGTFGDGLSIASKMYSAIAPMINTKKNRAGDTVHKNFFEQFGQNSLNTLDESRENLDSSRDRKLLANESNYVNQLSRSRSAARGINQLRAFDNVAASQKYAADSAAESTYGQLMNQLLAQKSNLEQNIDTKVMGGAFQADAMNRADRDAYYSNLGADISNLGEGFQYVGKDMNTMKYDSVMSKLLENLSSRIKVNSKGEVIKK